MYTLASQLIAEITAFERQFHEGHISGFEVKSAESIWSKKELLGHLIDSARYNLERFTEIQYAKNPYTVRPYNQDKQVKANQYQQRESSELLLLWSALNRQIAFIMQCLTTDTLALPLLLPNGTMSDLRFLMTDYIHHLQHHLIEIRK
ncbi:MAG: DinB family protein [Flavobacterium sp.]|nr:DinB family protein [Flavobacterium sp.]